MARKAKKYTYGLAARLDGGHRGKALSGKARDRYAALQSGGEPQHINVPEAPAHKRKSRKSDHSPYGKRN
jgi:hypothetical protein